MWLLTLCCVDLLVLIRDQRRYFLLVLRSPGLGGRFPAQMGLWNDKALQDVFSTSASAPPTAFYGSEGEGRHGC